MLPAAGVETAPWESPANEPAGHPESADPKGHALWTHSHCRQLVHDPLACVLHDWAERIRLAEGRTSGLP